ncbi:MAG TPA: hypothetical protein VGG95_01685 [Edaphobacter sp.]
MQRRLREPLCAVTLGVLCCGVLLVLHQAALLYTAYSGHDQAWYLIVADRVLQGAKLYGPYASDTNPPMVVWFSMLPVLLSRVLPLSPTICLRLVVLLLWIGSAVWCVRVLRSEENMEPPLLRALIGLGILFVGLRMDPLEFGQREHLFVMLVLPYLFAVSTEVVERLSLMERCALGIAAGLAVCFKPQQVLALIAAELVLIVVRRSVRRLVSPEVIALAVSCGFYLLAVRVLTPQYTKKMVPLLMDTYWGYGTSSVAGLLLATKWWMLLAVVLVATGLFLSRGSSLWMAVAVFGASSAGSLLSYAQQRTDWTYHRYPAASFLFLGVGVLLLALAEPILVYWQRREIRRPVAVVCFVMASVAGFGFFPRQMAALRPQRSEVYRFLEGHRESRSAVVLSTAVFWVADVADLKLEWGIRSPCLWFLPAIVQNEEGPVAGRPFKRLGQEKLMAISSLQRVEIAEDLNHFQPALVMVEHCDQKHPCQAIEGKNFDMLAWFLKEPQFQEEWAHYERQPDGPPSFDVYARVP